MNVCAYCRELRPMTEEHTWSKVLLKHFRDVAPWTLDPEARDPKRAKSNWEPRRKDLCSHCNGALSATDTAAGEFALSHLKAPIGTGTELAFSPALRRWIVKTAANHERASGNRDWWVDLVPFILGHQADHEELDLLFAPWWPKFPPQGYLPLANELRAYTGLAAMGVVPELGRAADWISFDRELRGGWALKVGMGVFMCLRWRPDAKARPLVVWSAHEFGWLTALGRQEAGDAPFNPLTALRWMVISNPNAALPLPRR